MKQKIKEALNRGYKNLGLNDEALERVATSIETLVTDETDLDAFVKNKAVEALMKFEQADADRKRTAQKKQSEGEKQEANTGNQSQNQSQQQAAEQPDFKSMLAEALSEVVNPLKEELAAIKAAKAKEDAVSALDNFVNGWDYASGFPNERDEAKRVALKVYKAGGEQLNGEQLIAAFREEFDPAVKKKGVTDFSQPFKGDGGGSDPTEKDAAFRAEIRAALGMDKGE